MVQYLHFRILEFPLKNPWGWKHHDYLGLVRLGAFFFSETFVGSEISPPNWSYENVTSPSTNESTNYGAPADTRAGKAWPSVVTASEKHSYESPVPVGP